MPFLHLLQGDHSQRVRLVNSISYCCFEWEDVSARNLQMSYPAVGAVNLIQVSPNSLGLLSVSFSQVLLHSQSELPQAVGTSCSGGCTGEMHIFFYILRIFVCSVS